MRLMEPTQDTSYASFAGGILPGCAIFPRASAIPCFRAPAAERVEPLPNRPLVPSVILGTDNPARRMPHLS